MVVLKDGRTILDDTSKDEDLLAVSSTVGLVLHYKLKRDLGQCNTPK